MKIAVILLSASFLCILSVAAADSHSHHPQTVEHHVKHTEGHDNLKKGNHHEEHKHAKKAGKNHHYDEEKLHKDNKAVKHKVEDAEKGGKKSEHHESDHHQTHKRAGAVAQHAAKNKQGAKDKKIHYSKGFREQFHKDEHKKHDSFFSNDKKAGEYHVYGGKNHKYQSNHYSKDNRGKYVVAKSADHSGKSGKKSDNHKIAVKKAYQQESGNNKQYAKHNKWAKSKTVKAY
ncbi:hypothetical protein RN001_015091 [Aquatica leii]|uniref:Uncharacterized protein n=1 Tax=Aquatica leii TaxID=1421715 RepID=A0AAN7SBW3_9COLE|nr:hypothetical protein RN001_015091 [Aquatica leii]